MAVQATFNVSHLRDYLRSAEGIHKMFEQLGYETYDPEPLDADDIDMSEVDARHVQAVYLVGSHQGQHDVYLFEVDDTTAVRLRGLAYDLLQRGGTYTIVVTKKYAEVIFVHPYTVGSSLTKNNTRVNKLTVDVANPTRHDADTINALLARGREADDIYKAQKDAFNVTKVTNKFYKEYRGYFERIRKAIVANNKGIPEFQNSDQRDKLHAFVQRLMGRLMFLYFLQRKGWLGEDRNFLTTLYKKMITVHVGELTDDSSYYYREVLEPLFFATLNTKRPDDITEFFDGAVRTRIPYLNGGLFDPGRDPAGPIIIPDACFDPMSNEGLLAFFNRYNFTISDDTPLEQDVAVDPEMLGKVFENMLEEEDRGQSGSFYTPRTIVSYMCQEALAGYLEECAALPRDEVRQHFDPDADAELSPEQAQRAQEALDTLTVLDPAVGSGSFLVGMMNEVLTMRRAAARALGTPITDALVAEWKTHTIAHTLYGVDIKPGAIEIAQLRLWLALVVNLRLEDARPLPNLDYKLMVGNSLIETVDGQPILNASAQAILDSQVKPRQFGLQFGGEGQDEARRLEDLRAEYFSAAPERRKDLGADIRRQERRIIEAGLDDLLEQARQGIANIEGKYRESGVSKDGWSKRDANKWGALTLREDRLRALKDDLYKEDAALPFFLYRLHFNDVFAQRGGFDVVIANPPYVRQELIREQKPELKVSYSDVYAGTADLFVYFFARARNLLAQGGQLAFITPNKFMRANYGKKLRGYLAKKARLHTLIDFGDLPIFDATTYPMITIASNRDVDGNQIKVLEITSLDESERLSEAADRAFQLPQRTLGETGWQLSAPEVRALIGKLETSSTPLGDYVDGKIYYGIKTGLNEAFIIDEAKRAELIAADPKSAEIIKPYLRGRDVKRWQISYQGLYILFVRPGTNINDYPAIKAHLEEYKEKLAKKSGSNQWYELQTNVAYHQEFDGPKIVYPDIAKRPEFGMDTDSIYINDTTFMIPLDDFFLLGVLNSLANSYYFSNISSTVRGGFLRFKNIYVKRIPIPDAPDDLRGKIASLAQQCLDAAKDNPDKLPALEAQLNQLVYQAYGLDEDDIRVIEGHLSGDVE